MPILYIYNINVIIVIFPPISLVSSNNYGPKGGKILITVSIRPSVLRSICLSVRHGNDLLMGTMHFVVASPPKRLRHVSLPA